MTHKLGYRFAFIQQHSVRGKSLVNDRMAKRWAAPARFLLMEEREQLLRDLERYRRLLRFTTDDDAMAAIEQLIREIGDRLDRLEAREMNHP